jgi:hypothetical protein
MTVTLINIAISVTVITAITIQSGIVKESSSFTQSPDIHMATVTVTVTADAQGTLQEIAEQTENSAIATLAMDADVFSCSIEYDNGKWRDEADIDNVVSNLANQILAAIESQSNELADLHESLGSLAPTAADLFGLYSQSSLLGFTFECDNQYILELLQERASTRSTDKKWELYVCSIIDCYVVNEDAYVLALENGLADSDYNVDHLSFTYYDTTQAYLNELYEDVISSLTHLDIPGDALDLQRLHEYRTGGSADADLYEIGGKYLLITG